MTSTARSPTSIASTAMRVSIVDLGSNSFRLLVADVAADGAIQPVLRAREFLRLGGEVAATGYLSSEAIGRAGGAFSHLAGLGLRTGAERSMAVATSAIRDTANSAEVVAELQAAAEVPIRVIDGQEEARLGFLGVASSVALPEGMNLVLDLGGGSLELAAGSGATPVWTESVDLGVSRLLAEGGQIDPLTPHDISALRDRVRATMEPIVPRVLELEPQWCVSVGGPNRALARVLAGAQSGWQAPTLNQTWMVTSELKELRARLVSSPLEERLGIAGVNPARAEQLPVAAVVVETILDLLEIDQTVISYWGLREGAVLDAYGNAELAFGSALRPASVARLERRFSPHAVHDAHVAGLAASLFDQLEEIHHMGSIARDLLGYAARLHTIGMGVGFRGYHRHGAYLIENSELRGFEPWEVALLASVVRFHRRGVIGARYEPFRGLNGDAREMANRLAAILHLADAADRGLDQSVDSIDLTVNHGEAVAVFTGADPEVRHEWVESAEAVFWKVFRLRLSLAGVRVVDAF